MARGTRDHARRSDGGVEIRVISNRCLLFLFDPHQLAGKSGAFDRSMQHHLINPLFKDGVYEALATIETFSGPENRGLEALEVWTVAT